MARLRLFSNNSSLGKAIQTARQKITDITADSLKRGVVFAGMMALGVTFMLTPNTASAASGVLKTTSYTAQLKDNNIIKVTLKLNKTGKVKVKKISGIKKIKKVKQSGKKVTVTMKVAKAGQCRLRIK